MLLNSYFQRVCNDMRKARRMLPEQLRIAGLRTLWSWLLRCAVSNAVNVALCVSIHSEGNVLSVKRDYS